jgi:hypothetical protein
METPRYSVSPLYSFCTVTPVRRSPKFSETIGAVTRWLTGRRRAPTLKQQFREAREAERIAEEIEALDSRPPLDSNPSRGRQVFGDPSRPARGG